MRHNLVYLFTAEGSIAYTFNPSERSFLKNILHPGFTSRIWGSVLLKTLMHARIVDSYKPEGWTQRCTNLLDIKDSFVIVHKQLFDAHDDLCELKDNNNFLIFDIIDSYVEDFSFADAILCCSHGSYDYYTRTQNKIPVLFTDHCVDVRLSPKAYEPLDKLHCYYFGSPHNFLASENILTFVTPCFSSLPHQPCTNWMDSLPLANFHYALRPPVFSKIFKPFTKGAIAAYHNANILLHQNDGDALHLLGPDYPYLLKEEPTEESVIALIKKAQDDFGGSDWLYGLSVMRSLKERYSYENISRQFWSKITALV